MYVVETLRSTAELEAVVPEWDRLCLSDPGATPFQTSAWALAWWRHFGRGAHHCVAVRDDGELIGLAPWYVARFPMRRMAFLGTGCSDYLDILVRADHRSEVMLRLLEALRDQRQEWDYLDLQQTPPSATALELAEIDPKRFKVSPHSTCPYLLLAGQDGMKRVPTSLSKNLRYSLRRLSDTGEVRFRCADETNLEKDLDALFHLHMSRWRSRGLPGVFASKRVQAFHREVAARFLKSGHLRLHLLELGGRVLAAALCYVFHGRAFYYGGGFHPDAAAFSPGSLIVGEAIRAAAAEGCREFDFLRGEEAYKRRWGCLTRRNHRIVAATNPVARSIAHRLPSIEASAETAGLRFLERYQRWRR